MTAVEKALAEMKDGSAKRKAATFVLPENRFHKHARKRDELASRRAIKRQVKPDNALALIAQLPAPGDTLHAILRGDFVLGDALPPLLRAYGPCQHLRVSTLALSAKNAETIRGLITAGQVAKCTLICSHFFRAVDKLSTFHAVAAILSEIVTLKVCRCHAKVMLLANDRGDHLVFEGSGNLRSSDSLEQLSVFNDPELFAFHAAWMDEVESEPLLDARSTKPAPQPHPSHSSHSSHPIPEIKITPWSPEEAARRMEQAGLAIE